MAVERLTAVLPLNSVRMLTKTSRATNSEGTNAPKAAKRQPANEKGALLGEMELPTQCQGEKLERFSVARAL
mgnify:CR=1 FL=1